MLVACIFLIVFAAAGDANEVPETYSLIVPDVTVLAPLGASVILPCAVSPTFSVVPLQMRWHRPGQFDTPVLLYENRRHQQDPAGTGYRGRVSLVGDLEQGNVSIKLENLKLSDRGAYTCYVQSDLWFEEANVMLTLKVIGTVPVLSVSEGKDDQVNVTCKSDGWSPQPEVTWIGEGGEITTAHGTVNTTDLSGRMFSLMYGGEIIFQGSSSPSNIDAITTCLRMVTDPVQRNINIFTFTMDKTISYTRSYIYEHTLSVNGESMRVYPVLEVPLFGKLSPWTSLCVTWDSDTGMTQLWKDEMMSSKKGMGRKLKFSGKPVMTISGFEGQLTDIHVWDKVLPLSSLHAYNRGWDYPSGNLLSWRNMNYTSTGYVVLEDSYQTLDKLNDNGRSRKQQQQRHRRRGDGKCCPRRAKQRKRLRDMVAL